MQVTLDGDSAYILRWSAQLKCSQNAALAATLRGETNKIKPQNFSVFPALVTPL
jgi:hypothetical protein